MQHILVILVMVGVIQELYCLLIEYSCTVGLMGAALFAKPRVCCVRKRSAIQQHHVPHFGSFHQSNHHLQT